MLKDPANEPGAVRVARMLWTLTAAEAPAWVLALAGAFATVWAVTLALPGQLVSTNEIGYRGMAQLMGDRGWSIWATLTAVLCLPAMIAPADSRRWAGLAMKTWKMAGLLASSSFFGAIGMLVVIVRPGRPTGWLHLLLACICLVAFWRLVIQPRLGEWRDLIEELSKDDTLE